MTVVYKLIATNTVIFAHVRHIEKHEYPEKQHQHTIDHIPSGTITGIEQRGKKTTGYQKLKRYPPQIVDSRIRSRSCFLPSDRCLQTTEFHVCFLQTVTYRPQQVIVQILPGV